MSQRTKKTKMQIGVETTNFKNGDMSANSDARKIKWLHINRGRKVPNVGHNLVKQNSRDEEEHLETRLENDTSTYESS